MGRWIDTDLDTDVDDEVAPWGLGTDEDDHGLFAAWDPDEDDTEADDPWLDGQLERLRNNERAEQPADPAAPLESDPEVGVVLRHPAATRSPRRRRAQPDAAADLPSPDTPGYVRDRRGTWRYRATGQAVPGARDLTLRSLYRFPEVGRQVAVPLELIRSEAELAWCMAWKSTLTTRLAGRRSVTVLRIPAGEWERRADIPFGLWAPELSAGRLLGIADVARLAGVSPGTVTAYLSRGRMPEPVLRIGHAPLWSRPVIRQWLASRPGQGRRTGR